ncbi:MAG: helix-turn-helix domain-containing protein [Chitinophagales bacterium]
MAQIFFSESFDCLKPFIKEWVKEGIIELIPALIQIHNSDPPRDELAEYINPEETCKLLGLSIPTLRKQTKAGIYSAYRVGSRKIQYRRSEIEKAIQSRRIDQSLPPSHKDIKKGGKR